MEEELRMLTDDQFEAKQKAFARTQLGRALGQVEKAVFRLAWVLDKQPHVAGTEDARRQTALRFITADTLRGRPLESFSGAELEILRILFANWRAATGTGPKDYVAKLMMELQLAGILFPAGVERETSAGTMDAWMVA